MNSKTKIIDTDMFPTTHENVFGYFVQTEEPSKTDIGTCGLVLPKHYNNFLMINNDQYYFRYTYS